MSSKRSGSSGPTRASAPDKSTSKDQFGWWFKWCRSEDPVSFWRERRDKRTA